MADVNWEVIILIIVIALIVFAGMGIFIGTRISSDKRRIRELEDELAETRKELDGYRSKVNTHFKKTSELFSQMTSSYRAIYMHLAEGSQELCTTDAALLKPANGEFLKVTHEQGETAAEKSQEQAAQEPAAAAAVEEEVRPEAPAAENTSQQGVEQQVREQVSADDEKAEETAANVDAGK